MTSAETSKIQSKLSALSSSLDDLESVLQPLLSGTLAESIVNLEPLQQAKLQTVLPYAVYDLVFMYLKMEGVDPKTHPVVGELGRIKEYFDKISNTENPPQRRVEVDQAAAGRFIKAAISQAKWKKTAAEEAQDDSEKPEASSSAAATTYKPSVERVPVKMTSKMLERQMYEEELKKADAEGEEEEGLEVFEEEEGRKGGEQAMEVDEPPSDQAMGKKRGRPVLDPFQGYGEEIKESTSAGTSSLSTLPDPPEGPKKKKKKASSTPSSASKKEKAK